MVTTSHLGPFSRRRGAIALAAGGLLLTAACGGSSATTSSAGSGGSAPSQVHVTTISLGKAAVAPNGRTLYLLTSDKNGKTTCTGSCLQEWPPVMVTTASPKADGVSNLGTLMRGSNMQLTIGGHPVYTYSGDAKAGDVNGEGIKDFGGIWYAVSPSGDAIKSSSGGGGTIGY